MELILRLRPNESFKDLISNGGKLIVQCGAGTFITHKMNVDLASLQEAADENQDTVLIYDVVFKPENIIEPTFSYHNYIKSSQWKDTADLAKALVGNRCQVCNRHKDEVTLDAHHRTYKRLGNEAPNDITILCRDCHELYHKSRQTNG